MRKVATKQRNRLELGILNNVFEESSVGEMFNISNARVLESNFGENFVDVDRCSTSDSEDDQNSNVSYFNDDRISDEDNYVDDSSVGDWYSRPTFKNVFSESQDLPNDRENLDKEVKMPKTEKEKRSIKRKKAMEKRARKMEESLVEDDNFDSKIDGSADISDRHKQLISQGLGKSSDISNHGFEIVNADTASNSKYEIEILPADDNEKFTNLALGSVMLNPKKKKEIIDASYNRYSWEIDSSLPDWFIEDEMRHNKPEIPLPSTLVNQVMVFRDAYQFIK